MAFDGNVVIGTTVDQFGMNEGLKRMEKSFKKLNRLSMNLLSVAGLVRLGREALKAASNLQEVQNIVDVSFGDLSYKMEKFAETAIRSYGMSEYSAKKTGSAFMAMGKSMGLTAEEASNMAVRLTALSGDFASFYNISQEYAQIALSGIYTGESRTLKKYGLVITEANLQQYALTKGIQTQVKNMDARSKALLRYNYILEATKDMTGDFVRTQNSWANQTRILKEQWNQFLITLGSGLITILTPLIKTLNSILAAMIAWANKLGAVIGKLLGIEWQDLRTQMIGSGQAGDDLADVIDDMADAEDGLADATEKAMKKQKKQLQTYDELNNVTTDTKKGTEDITTQLGVPTLDGLAADVTGGFGDIKDSMLDAIDSWYSLGDYIGTKLTEIFNSIDWDSIYAKARNFGTGLAEFLNGLISPELFRSVGHTIAGALNTALHFLDSFGETFDFYQFGASIGAGLNEFLRTFDWKTALSASKNWGQGAADALNGFLRETDFTELGNTVSQFANTIVTFFANGVKTLDWSKVGTSLGTGVNGILNNFDWRTTLSAVEHFSFGLADTINGAFATIKWENVGTSAANLLNALFLAIKDLCTRLQWKDIGRDIATAVTSFFRDLKVSDIAESINALVQGIWTAIYYFVTTTDWKVITDKIAELVSNVDVETVAIIIGAITLKKVGTLLLGFQLIPWLRTALLAPFVEGLSQVFNVAFGLMAANIPSMGAIEAFHTAITAVFGTVGPILAGIASTIGGIILSVKGFIMQWQDGISVLGQVFMVLGTILSTIGLIVAGVTALPVLIIPAIIAAIGELALLVHENWDAIKELWADFVADVKENWGEFVGGLKSLWDDIKTGFSDTVNNIKQGWDSFVLELKTKWEEFKTAVKTGFNNIKTEWSGFISNIKTSWNGFISNIKTKWDDFKTTVKTGIDTIKQYWDDKIDNIKQKWDDFKSKVEEVFSNIKEFIDDKATNVKDKWDEVIGNIKGFFDDLHDKATGVFDTIKEFIDDKVDLISEKFGLSIDNIKEAFDSVPDFFREHINDIIGFFENMTNNVIDCINAIIGGLNKISFEAPDWAPDWIAGKTIGINLSEISPISIPRLAQGAVIPPNRQFMAVLGDQTSGTNIEAPLATIQEALYNALLQAGLAGGNNNQDIVVQIDGREVARAVRRENNIFKKSTGTSMFAY